MSARADGSFTVTSWQEQPRQQLAGDTKVTSASVTFRYDGDLAADATWDAVMYYRQDGSAVYTGLQAMTGRLAGREGSFVLRSDGRFEGGTAASALSVVEGSATGELAGLRGTGTAVTTGESGGTFSLDYELDGR